MIRINAYAESSGAAWLFDDLKIHFQNVQMEGVEVLASNFPLKNADAYIAIRTGEIKRSPCPEKTVVCIHDLYNDRGTYLKGGDRYQIHTAGALVLCHPQQKHILQAAGIKIEKFRLLERPLGALAVFEPADKPPEKFTIAWVGRNYWRKRIEWFMEAVKPLTYSKMDFRIILLGMDIEEPAESLRKYGIECLAFPRKQYPISAYPAIYKQMSCLVITGITEAGPLTLFEALSCGLPVVSTKVGWAPQLSGLAADKINLVETPEGITVALKKLYARKESLFQQRYSTKKLVEKWTLDSWVKQVVEEATALTITGVFSE